MRHRPPPLQRLSAGAGPHDPGKGNERFPSAAGQHMYSPLLRTPAVSVVAPFHDITPSDVHSFPNPTNHYTHARTQSGVPALPPMFRIGSRSKSPRRAASAMYSANGVDKSTTDMHPGSPVTIANMPSDPHSRPFSPWGSTDSQSSTSPRNSTKVAQKAAYNGKRSLSPTAPSVSNMSMRSKASSKSFLSRGRKQSGLTEEFDPTTFRKNRTRPSPSARGGDALYHEYDDLFDDSLEEHADDGFHTSDGADGEEEVDGFFLLQVDEHPARTSSLEDSPHLSPKALRSDDPPRSVPSPYRRASPPPPMPPPKSWRRSLVPPSTPPPSNTPSVDESLDPLPGGHILSAPPTPPRAGPPLLTIQTNVDAEAPGRRQAQQQQRLQTMGADAAGSPQPPHHPPPPTPPLRRKRFSRRVSTISANTRRPRSIPDGLGIINIPSPTLFSSEFSPAAGDTWAEHQFEDGHEHTLGSPALTAHSYTPRQPPRRGSVPRFEDDDMDNGVQSDPGEGAGDFPPALTARKFSMSAGGFERSEAGTIKGRPLQAGSGNTAGGDSATSTKSVDTLLDGMLTESDASGKEEVIEINRPGISDEKEVVVGSVEPDAFNEKIPVDQEKEVVKEEEDGRLDAAYLRAFKAILKTSGEADPFNYRLPRYDRVQAQRITNGPTSDNGINSSPVRRSSKARRNSKARQDAAKEDIITNMYALMAVRWLEFGKVITSPAHETLLAASVAHLKRRATVKMDKRATQMLASVGEASGSAAAVNEGETRRRVLDLGGLPVADWGWHCASDYPKVKVYTVTQRPAKCDASPISPGPNSPLMNHRGPKNHRHLAVDRLCRLPFPANHFDVVSARTLFLTLKTQAPSKSPNQLIDEYDKCLEECMRILKPGGYLEFNLFDSEVINPGPIGERLARRFSEELRAKGYDPEPTKRWVSRLNRAGFAEIKRAWLFMPMAPPASKPKVPSKTDHRGSDGPDLDVVKEEVRRKMEAWEDLGVKKGTLANVAPVTGLVGGWVWEKWMLIAGLGTNQEGDESRLSTVMDEGKEMGSGWRALVGWARKPVA